VVAAQRETLWAEAPPIEVRELSADRVVLEELLRDPGCWRRRS
jgi:hypothetical protein